MDAGLKVKSRTDKDFWSEIFLPDPKKDLEQSFMINTLQVSRTHILTAKLRSTLDFFDSIKGSETGFLSKVSFSFDKVVDCFSFIATFDIMARSEYGRIRRPGFWIKSRKDHRMVPAIPLDIAAEIYGATQAEMRIMMSTLAKDGAVDIVQSATGTIAITMRPGFINEAPFKPHLKIGSL